MTGDWHLARVTRSIESNEPSEASQDLIELIESTLERRRFADAVTLEVSAGMPGATVARLLDDLELDEQNVVRVDALVGKADLLEIAELTLPAMRFKPIPPAVPRSFKGIEGSLIVLTAISVTSPRFTPMRSEESRFFVSSEVITRAHFNWP